MGFTACLQPTQRPAPSGCSGPTRRGFHAADTDILVWLLPILSNMSAVPSTDSCALSSAQTSVQAASRGCWLFSSCL